MKKVILILIMTTFFACSKEENDGNFFDNHSGKIFITENTDISIDSSFQLVKILDSNLEVGSPIATKNFGMPENECSRVFYVGDNCQEGSTSNDCVLNRISVVNVSANSYTLQINFNDSYNIESDSANYDAPYGEWVSITTVTYSINGDNLKMQVKSNDLEQDTNSSNTYGFNLFDGTVPDCLN